MERHLENLTALICLWTPDGVLSSCNEAYSRFLGVPADKLIGRRWLDLLPGKHRSSAVDFIQDFLANPREYRREQVIRNANGELRWVDWIGQPIHDDQGRLVEVLSEGRDITERKRAEEAARESERRYRLLFEEATEGMVLADAHTGVLEDCNYSFLRLTGYERSEVLGRPLPLAGDAVDAPTFPARLAAYRHDSRTVPARLLAKGGAVRDVTLKGSIVQLDGRELVHAFVHDATQERMAERFRDASLVLLRLLNEHDQTRELLRQLADLLRVWTGCEAVAIRLREGDDFPFYETRGYSADFARSRSLCPFDQATGRLVVDEWGKPVLDCLCGRVISGEVDRAASCFSQRGSFWTNSLASLPPSVQHTRVHCLREGYDSVALIPLHSGDDTVGMLQLSDRSAGRFNPALIEFLERAGEQIGVALAQKAKMSSLEGGLRQIAALIAEIGVGDREAPPTLPPALRAALARLSRRETEVLRLLLTNRRPTTIARELSRSVHTVRNQLKAIFRKLNVHSQEELLSRLGPNPSLLAARPQEHHRRPRRRTERSE